ncbi:acidic fibroblast growth factor intracellular-binding protein isoform X5 [Heterocephalus glaber]|uniref:Acidic fibroblast growth factor intracellular-binding protein isoform X5 n=1 Tax=Heterocephalus glaber TaxID=10181 RepID=A0AAX6TIS7_HETGA|nr:acidic fibroblast growth factor intracellular-binding protein isoform X5 [Heterocephalus glaber]
MRWLDECAPESWSRREPRQPCCRATPWTTIAPSTCSSACCMRPPNCCTSSSSRSRPPGRLCSLRGTMLLMRPLFGRSWARSCPRVPRKTWTTSAPKQASPLRAAGDSLTTLSESSRWWRKCGAPSWITSSNTSSSLTGCPGKKKLQYLSFGDFAFCAELMIQNWTLGAVDSQVDDMDVDLDKEFLQDLKELKVLVADKDLLDLHKSLVCTALRGKLSVFSEMEANFKPPASGAEDRTPRIPAPQNLSRGLVNVAAKLIHNKDVRDLFVDLIEKFVEPCRSDHWPLNDVRLFLNQYSASVHSLDGFRHQTLWDRYMGTLRGCLLRLYHD